MFAFAFRVTLPRKLEEENQHFNRPVNGAAQRIFARAGRAARFSRGCTGEIAYGLITAKCSRASIN